MPNGLAGEIDFHITLDGAPIEGLLHASITTTNCFSSDSFALTFATGKFPLGDIAFWSSMPPTYVEIVVSTADELLPQLLISGMIDAIHVDPIQGTVAIEGRDLSSSMIDGYRQQDFVNQTASEVVSAIAVHHGLTPVVTGTSGSVGRYYGDGYTRLSLGQFSRLRSDWDLVAQLARENSFDAFVQGANLFFQPSAALVAIPVHIALGNVKTMRFERTMTIASDTTAKVQSWNSQNMTSYGSAGGSVDSGAPPASTTAASTTPADQPFLFSASNFTSQQVSDSAARYAAELRRLEIVMHIEMPWDLTLSPRSEIFVDETNSAFDTIYQVDHIERRYSTTAGSRQTIRAIII